MIDLSALTEEHGGKEGDQKEKEQQEQKLRQERSVESLVLEEASMGFDLSSGPLMRVKLVVLAPREHILLVTFHHIISDGWSMNIFFRELSHLYNTYEIGQESELFLSSLPSLPIQYADFALWQRGWLQGEVLEEQISYWKNQLSNIPELLEIRTDRPRPKELTYKGASCSYTLSKGIRSSLSKISEQNGCSLFMTLLAIFQVLLYRYTGQKDIVVGSPIANRHYQEIEGLIGFFVNTLALRTSFEKHESFIDVLNRVKETTLEAYQHQDVPFEQLVDHLNVTRELNRNPVFQVMFTLESGFVEEQPLALKEVQTTSVFSSVSSVAKFDLSLSAFEHDEAIDISFDYATDLFEEETIKRLAQHFEELTKEIIKDVFKSLDTISLLTAPEKHQLLIEWNDTKEEYPEARDKTITQLFEEQVERTPDNVAVVYESQELTYKQLNEKANQLAHYLRSLGVGPDTLVAIAVERSLEMIIGLLGILKAGGAYVPLDSDYPEERLKFMLDDTGTSIILTQGHLQEKLKGILVSYTGVIIIIDQIELVDHLRSEPTLSKQSIENPVSITLPEHLAYLIYTSGSTGRPKGVMVGHGNLSHYLNYSREVYFIQKKAITLLHSSIAFDMSITSLYIPLTTGNIIYMPTAYSQSNSLEEISKELDRINFLKLTPTHLKVLKNQSTSWNISNKERCLVIGGENLLKEDIAFLFHHNSSSYTTTFSIFNEYGPTEATVGCCLFKIDQLQLDTLNLVSIPIGRPISNTQIYILDSYMNPVPIGIAGEIYIGGAGLARGYLNRGDLTAEKFIPNPFILEKESIGEKITDEKVVEYKSDLRLYRSGDLARYLPDGNIEFLGRIDDQVKIRGFRIELGEIESTLNAHGDVTQAVVVAREDGQNDEPSDNLSHKQLVAYVVSGEFNPSNIELQEFLIAKLPDYMIPAFFVYLDKIPLTPNGKIDRKALPAPDLSVRQVGDEYVAPRSMIEQSLVSIWSEVLKIEKIGIHDNFFKLGGHSLLAVRLIVKINQVVHKKLSVMDVFKNPTILLLSYVIKSDIENISSSPIFCIQSNDKNPPMFLLHPGGGLAYDYVKLAKYITDIPIYGINHPNFIDPSIIFNSIEEIARFYINLIKKEQKEGPYFLGGWSYGGLIAYEMAIQLYEESSEVKQLILIDPTSPNPQKLMHNDDVLIEDHNNIEKPWNFMTPEIQKRIEQNLEDTSFAVNEYKPRNYNGSIVLLKAKDKVKEPNLIEDYGWKKIAKKIKVIEIPGNHTDLFEEKLYTINCTSYQECM